MDHPTDGAMPPLPDLPKLADLASKYAINYASPHHFVMSVYGLKFLLIDLGVDHAPLIARVAELQSERDAANKLLKRALQPLELYNAYGWSDRAGVRASIKEHLAALTSNKEQQP